MPAKAVWIVVGDVHENLTRLPDIPEIPLRVFVGQVFLRPAPGVDQEVRPCAEGGFNVFRVVRGPEAFRRVQVASDKTGIPDDRVHTALLTS